MMVVLGVLPIGLGDRPLLPPEKLAHLLESVRPAQTAAPAWPITFFDERRPGDPCNPRASGPFGMFRVDVDSSDSDEDEELRLNFGGRRVRQRVEATQDPMTRFVPGSDCWTMVPPESPPKRKWPLKI